MGEIANLTGNTADAENYTNTAHNYISKWTNLGINKNATPPHTPLTYGNDSSAPSLAPGWKPWSPTLTIATTTATAFAPIVVQARAIKDQSGTVRFTLTFGGAAQGVAAVRLHPRCRFLQIPMRKLLASTLALQQ